MTKIEDVAREAKVSVATVSRVINNSGDVRPETARKVRAAIDKMEYVPNLSARNLRRNESRVILILTPNFTNPYYSKILSGICDTSRDMGYSTLIYNTYDSSTLKEELLVELFRANNADGMILLACNHDDDWLEKYKGRYAIVQCSEYSGADMPHISVDNRLAAYDMVTSLIDQGHRRIGLISSTNRYMSTVLRQKGYVQALADAGFPFDQSLVVCADPDYSFPSGKQAARALLERNRRPTAVFCVSDILALGAISVAGEKGLVVPGDLSVTGFDDVDYTTMIHPYLTTVAVPCYELGCESMRLLEEHIHHLPDARSGVFLRHTLVRRESAGEPKLLKEGN